MELYIDIISNTEESVSTTKHGVREHVTFNVIARQILDKINDPPPTFIAQTKKHGEEQILKEVKKKSVQIESWAFFNFGHAKTFNLAF